jgi:HAD superfamily hydrolase (TIGR01549 family)
MTTIRGVLLDMDGTLIDSNDAHARSWVEAFTRGGHSVSFERVRKMIGMGSDQLIPRAVGVENDSPEGRQLSEWWKEIFKAKYLTNLRPFPCVRQLVEAMKVGGLKIVIASSSDKELLDRLLAVADIKDLVPEATSADDADASKPEPDIVEAALKRIGLPANEVVMLGDTPYDIEAASKVGVAVIGLRCGGWTDDELAGAIEIYQDPADLLAQLDNSILGGNRADTKLPAG